MEKLEIEAILNSPKLGNVKSKLELFFTNTNLTNSQRLELLKIIQNI